MDEHMRAWTWSRPSEDKYCNALSMEHNDSHPCEPYVDSLSQLNKIVERILPEKSPLSLMSVRPKHDIPSTLRRSSYVDHGSGAQESYRRPSVASRVGEFQHESPTKHMTLSTVPSVCLEDSLRLKALRPSDSLNDSAYETYCGDGSNDAIDSEEKVAKTDEFSFGNDQADYCSSSSGRKSADYAKSVQYTKEKEAEMHNSGFMKKFIGEQVIGSNYCGNSTRRKSLDSAIACELPAVAVKDSFVIKHSTLSEPILTGSGRKPSSLHVRDELFSGKRGSSALSDGDSTCDNSVHEKYNSDETYGTNANTSARESTSYAVKHGSGPSSCVPQRTLSVDSNQTDYQTGNARSRSSVASADEELKSFTCPHCAYSASKKGQVRKHLSVHGIFLCAHCEFACDRADLLEEHRRHRHPGLCGRRLCKKCRVLFQSTELEAHEQQCSGEKQRWACHTCGKEFKFLSVMKAHAHKWHPAIDDGASVKPTDPSSDTASSKPCSVSSGTPTTTQPESTGSREDKQFQCPECGKMFKTKWTLANHSLLHAGADTPFCCDVDGCSGVTFRSDKELNCHRMAVHRLGPTKYQCSHPGCTMQFAKYGHYKRHQLTHSASTESGIVSPDVTSRRFVCDWSQCGKAFSHPDNLRVHYRRHTDEKPYHCHHCEAAYRQKSGLKYHLDKVHGEKPVGRMCRKRKLAAENSSVLVPGSVKQILPSSAFISNLPVCKAGDLSSPVGQTILSNSNAGSGSSVVASGMSAKVSVSGSIGDSQAKQWAKSESGGAAKSRKWSESLSQRCQDDLENIDINDEWLLNEDDGFITSHPQPLEVGVDGDRDPTGSTSDTEPLDEDLCEELRKLSDAINSEVLSPHGLDTMSSPFSSPIGPAFSTMKPDNIGNVLPDVSMPHPSPYDEIGSQKDHAPVYDQYATTSPHQESDMATDFYSRNPEAAVGTSSIHGLGKSEDQSEMVNGYVADGYSCPEWRPTHFDGSSATTDSSHLAADGLSYHSAPCEGPVHPWSVAVNYSRWSSQLDNPAFLPPHSGAAHPTTTAGYGEQIGRHNGTHANSIPMWSSSSELSQQWPGRDGLISSWSRHQMAMRMQPDLYAQQGCTTDWRIGRQGPSAFSRSGPVFERRTSFDVALQANPRDSITYRADAAELPSVSDRFVDSYIGKRAGVYRSDSIGSSVGSWPELYEQSPHMEGIGSYDYHLPRNVRRSPLQSDRLHLASGYAGIQSPTIYERGMDADSVYCMPNGPYPMLPGHATSWPMSGLSGAGESLRRMPDIQQSSVLYNVVPRYY